MTSVPSRDKRTSKAFGVEGVIVKPSFGAKTIEPLASVVAVIVKALPSANLFLTTVPFVSEIDPSSL